MRRNLTATERSRLLAELESRPPSQREAYLRGFLSKQGVFLHNDEIRTLLGEVDEETDEDDDMG